MDISYSYCYSYRVDIDPNECKTPEQPWEDEEAVVYQFVDYIDKKCKYYVGELEYSDKGKPHFQMCLMFDKQPDRQQFMNVKTRKWVAKTKQPVSFKKARNDSSLMSYCTKDNPDQLISNMTNQQRKGIKPWEKKEHCKGCTCKAYERTEYIIKYIKKLLKDKKVEECKKYEEYMKSYPGSNQHSLDDYYETNAYESCQEPDDNYIPSSSECKELLATAHAHYFSKYEKHICRQTLIKIMLKSGMLTHKQYIEKTLGNLLSDEYV